MGKQETNSVDLKSFICDILVNITEGISDANSKLSERLKSNGNAFEITKSNWGSEKEKIANKGIEFDLLIAATKSSSKEGGFSVAVPIIGEAGFGGNTNNALQQTSRIKFNVDVNIAINSLHQKQELPDPATSAG